MSDNVLSVSALKTFRECPRKYQLMYEERWKPVREPEPLRFGTLIHAALEGWWHNALGDRLKTAFRIIGEKAQDELDRIKAEEILRGYDARWSGELTDFELVRAEDGTPSIERRFEVPLLDPRTLEQFTTWKVRGKVDVLAVAKVDGEVEVWEHKTTSREIESDGELYWDSLPMDPQISCYVLASEAFGTPATRCRYDVIRKPDTSFRKATPEDKRKYTKKGELYANQREHDETPDEFRARLREEISDNLNGYFRRKAIPRLNSELAAFLEDAFSAACEIAGMRMRRIFPRNTDACFARYRCQFYDVCAHGVDPGTSAEFYRQPQQTEGGKR